MFLELLNGDVLLFMGTPCCWAPSLCTQILTWPKGSMSTGAMNVESGSISLGREGAWRLAHGIPLLKCWENDAYGVQAEFCKGIR